MILQHLDPSDVLEYTLDFRTMVLFILKGEQAMKLSEIELFEEECEKERLNDELYEMANIHSSVHGIDDVVIWVGKENKRHGLRVKVSNVKNKYVEENSFNIKMPSLDYNPRHVAKWITTRHMKAIFNWIKLNQKLLYDYEKGIMDDTFKFLHRLSPVNM